MPNAHGEASRSLQTSPTALQRREVALFFEDLIERVRSLREDGLSAPSDEELSLLFTDADDYEVDDDDEVTYCLATLHGLAIGLGYTSTCDLFDAYLASLKEAESPALASLLEEVHRAAAELRRSETPELRELEQRLLSAASRVRRALVA